MKPSGDLIWMHSIYCELHRSDVGWLIGYYVTIVS